MVEAAVAAAVAVARAVVALVKAVEVAVTVAFRVVNAPILISIYEKGGSKQHDYATHIIMSHTSTSLSHTYMSEPQSRTLPARPNPESADLCWERCQDARQVCPCVCPYS